MKFGGILAIVLAAAGVAIAQDVRVVGATSLSVTPDVNVVGAYTVDAASLPLPSVLSPSPSPNATPDIAVAGSWTTEDSHPFSRNKAITVALPLVISIVAFVGIVGAFFVYRRHRARRSAAAAATATDGKHAWVNRPGGWAKDETAAESGQAKY
ncbi:hypothetical protein FRC17_003529 [Serendipita sp. 399]|nr:hypothetical protein FRC17_003529 [Serendipita sp. 399]